MKLSAESAPQSAGTYWVKYASAKNTTVTVTVDQNGKVTDVEIRGAMSERYGEWTQVKDAALALEKLAVPAGAQAVFRGGACSAGERQDYGWGYILAGNMNDIFVMMHWN